MVKQIFVAAALVGVAACSTRAPGHGGGGGGGGGGTCASGAITITPANQVLTATYGMAPPTLQLMATITGQSAAPTWSVDRGEIGTIDAASGLFTAAGTIGGTANVTATYCGLSASTTVTVHLTMTQNGDPDYPPKMPPGPGGYGGTGGNGPGAPPPGGVSFGNPTADTRVHILYPYDATVWPRGLFAPLLQWDPGTRNFDAVQISVTSKSFSYTGAFGNQSKTAPFINVPIPVAAWHALTYSNAGGSDDAVVTLVFHDATAGAIGPYKMTWHIAPGTLKGTVYYNSYGTSLVTNSMERSCSGTWQCSPDNNNANNGSYFGAATLAIRPGKTDPVVVAGKDGPNDGSQCRVCHTVSANGATLLTQHGDQYQISSSYALTNNNLEAVLAPGTQLSFPALYPDGTWFMSSSGGMINTDSQSQAWNISGARVAAQPGGLPSMFQAALPAFSPDGKHLVYDDWTGGNDTKTLRVIDFDAANNAFGTARTLYKAGNGTVSWSSFLPTSDAVVFENELAAPQYGFTRYTGVGVLMWTDLATKTTHTLDNANGVKLPTYGTNHSQATDSKLNFEPTVNPVVSGGYAWVVFTSRRLYGNVATIDPYASDPREYHWTDPTQYTPKKLWVAAIDLNAAPGTDPSHPAFYLPGQELVAGNARGFWTVEPCRKDGTTCETGDECCNGYCRPSGDMGGLTCQTPSQPMCSMEFETCKMTSDCCAGKSLICVNGHCANPVP